MMSCKYGAECGCYEECECGVCLVYHECECEDSDEEYWDRDDWTPPPAVSP